MADGSVTLQVPGVGTQGTDPSKPAAGEVHSRSDGTSTIVPKIESTPAAPAADPNRPAWLDQKFANPEALAAAYKELEAKLGAKTPAADPAPAAAATDPTKALSDADMAELSAEYAQNGQLSEARYKSLAGKGLSKTVVDAYIDGQKAVAAQKVTAIQEHVGGKDALDSLFKWAGESLSDTEIKSVNQILTSGNMDAAKVALDGLKARYVAANGSEPSLVSGRGVSASGDMKPFRSNAEITKAINDPRYKTDEAYRNDVYARLNITNI